MLPTVNGKTLMECNETDLLQMIDNPDFKENDYLDFKKMLFPLNATKEQKEEAKVELRNDVSSFANADGGYLLLGIAESNGIANELSGIEIKDGQTDKFELNLRTWLSPIQPQIPSFSCHFVPLQNGKFIVILLIRHDDYAPYIQLENEKDYRIYKRSGNNKTVIKYVELKKMFSQSLTLDRLIDDYRKERIQKWTSIPKCALIHIIPDSIANPLSSVPIYQKCITGEINMGAFKEFTGASFVVPTVNGASCHFYNDNHSSITIFDNLIGELVVDLQKQGYVETRDDYGKSIMMFWAENFFSDRIKRFYNTYISTLNSVLCTKRYFICMSIIGCENAITKKQHLSPYSCYADSNSIICSPITLVDFSSEDDRRKAINQSELAFYFSLGIRNSDSIQALIKELS